MSYLDDCLDDVFDEEKGGEREEMIYNYRLFNACTSSHSILAMDP